VTLRERACDLDAVGEALAIRLELPGPEGFGVEAPGRLGECGRILYEYLATSVAARTSEAAGQRDRVLELAAALRMASERYTEADTLHG
jgi:hypothetical protein